MVNERRQTNKLLDEETNPCIKEHNLVNQCLIKQDYNTLKCEVYFENYRQCKMFWDKLCGERKRTGIKPFMPGKEEREKIMKDRNEAIDKLKMKYQQ